MKHLLPVSLLLLLPAIVLSDDPQFVLGINLNGPPVVIDGNHWQGQDSPHYECDDNAFENPNVKLIPPTDAARAKMIRSSRWGGNRIALKDLPTGELTLYLYVWEDNNSESYDVSINQQVVLHGHKSGMAGHWDRLGPWYVQTQQGQLVIESRGGAANFSGLELWQGKHNSPMHTEASAEDLAFFEKRIRPVLIEHCYSCHASDSSQVEGELLLDSMAAMRRGGSNGPALVPGDPDSSLLIKAIRYRDSNLQMPPDGRLSNQQIQDFEEWIARGAADPRTSATQFQRKQFDYSAAKDFWSLKPLMRPPVPTVVQADWPASPIDYFVLAKIEQHQFVPNVDADRRTWIRRATFDLIGLPPTPAEVAAFVADPSPEAYQHVVDRLLQSPRYGERWGRYWLDVVRYADTAGDNSDFPIPQMHLYRDWVIDCFNRDMPYDQFVVAQLAGDLLPFDSPEQARQQNIATGYIANSRRFGSRVSDYPQHLTIEDTLDNFGRAFLGLTINCARCHDHKFDPISMADYYGLYGIFDSTRYPWPGIELEQRQRDLVPIASPEQVTAFENDKRQKQDELDAEVKRLESLVKRASPADKPALEKQVKEAQNAARVNSQRTPPYELLYAVAERSNPSDATIQLKGDPAKPGDRVPRKFLTALGGQHLPDGQAGSGRLHLAQWLLQPSNPLPARVMVNRIWQYHFGKAIVPTPNDFGKQGKPPTHPELLDWLATQFIEDGWSIKSLHRRIMLSRTYRLASRTQSSFSDQSSEHDRRMLDQANQDPNNDWLSAYPRHRLDAEALRDTLLMLGGTLDLSPAGPHPFPPQDQWKFTQHNPFKAEYESQHRSVYLMTQRIQRHSYLAIFDGADPSVSTAQRLTTTTPLQSLYLLNDQLVHQQAEQLANRLLSQAQSQPLNDQELIAQAFELCLARQPTAWETSQALQFLDTAQSKFPAEEATASHDQSRRLAWQAFARVMFRLNEFITVD